jgi:hypothetical protein
MICKECRQGGTMAAANRDDQGTVLATVRAMVKAFHDLCKGCDCAHKMDKMLQD